VTIPGSVKEILWQAFSMNENLKSVKLSEGIKTIDYTAFDDCPKLTKINIPKSLDDSSLVAYRSKTKLEDYLEDFDIRDNGLLYKYNGTDANVYIPEGVKIICNGAFRENNNIELVEIPEGVVSIEDDAFASCSDLTIVKFPDSLKNIGDYAFFACNLQKLQLPEGLISIGENAFYYNTWYLKEVHIPDTVTSIGRSAFGSCHALVDVSISNKVARIEKNTFIRCDNLRNIIVPSNVTYIARGAFGGSLDNTKSVNLTVLNKNAYLDNHVFYGFDYREATIISPAGGSVQRMASRNKISYKKLK